MDLRALAQSENYYLTVWTIVNLVYSGVNWYQYILLLWRNKIQTRMVFIFLLAFPWLSGYSTVPENPA